MSLKFHRPTLDDKIHFNKIIQTTKNVSSETTFGTCYLWADAYDVNIYIHDGIIFKTINNGLNFYGFPKGVDSKEKIEYAIKLLNDDFLSKKLDKLRFTELLNSEVNILKDTFPNKFSFELQRNDFEYIYSIHDLATLKGKKYHSKRNHISKFNKLYNWSYEPISSYNKLKCLEYCEKWFELHKYKYSQDDSKEYSAIKKAIDNYEVLGLIGGIIRVKDKIVALTIGEKINSDTLLVHFEKASPEFEGSYNVINNEFCKYYSKKFKLINREEDMGIPGLRKAKLSYKPKFLIEKYNAKWKV